MITKRVVLRVFTAVRALKGEGYGVSIWMHIVDRWGKDYCVGTISRALAELKHYGLVEDRLSQTLYPERGGRHRRYWSVTT